MRCLYCGKELALLKRFTGGAEFCSDAHRKKYQEQFDDLALNRLTQPPPALPREPLPVLVDPPEELVIDAGPPPKPIPAPIKVPPKVEKDPVVGMISYLIEEPRGEDTKRTIAGRELELLDAVSMTLPARAFHAIAAANQRALPWASPIALEEVLAMAAAPIQQRGGALEIREFSHQAVAAAVTPEQTLQTNEIARSSALGESMEITNQPRPPAYPPAIWQAGPQSVPAVDLVLGDLARLQFSIIGWGDAVLPEPASQPPVAPVEAQPWTEPAAASVQAADAPAVPEGSVPDPVTRSLPLELQVSSAGTAKPVAIVGSGVLPSIEPQIPRSSGLPLRPRMVLVAKSAEAEPQARIVTPAPPVPKAIAVAPVVTAVPSSPVAAPPLSSPAGRPLRGPGTKNRRPEVRVVQTGPAPQRVAVAPPVAQPNKPAAPASPPPLSVEKPAASVERTPVRTNTARSTLIPQDTTVKPTAKPEVELNLPELHNPEVVNRWTGMPMGARAGVGAVVALAIIGFSYYVLNSSNASATAPAAAAPAYVVGKQINSGGWNEDWAPADSQRRVTLLRGSQPYSDYRIEFNAQIQNKAIGWMFRGVNPKNYYVVKLEKLKPGIEPVVALVRYAVIDGNNERRTETILPMKVRVDTTYKIRFDAVGSQFTTWVQGQKVDEWRDTRLGSGGLGLYAEGDEAAAIHGIVNVFELTPTR